jgi:tetratricopeptide (TPR) repeat protein
VNFATGELGKAQEGYQEALETFRLIGNQRGQADQLNALANISDFLGHPSEARQQYEKAGDLYREVGDHEGQAKTLCNLGSILIQSGDLGGAERSLKQAASLSKGDESGLADVRSGLGELFTERGELERARESYALALTTRHDLKQRSYAAINLLDLGRLRLEEDPPRLEQATGYFKDALSQFEGQNLPDNEAEARALLARAYAAQRSSSADALAKASTEIERAKSLAAKSANVRLRIIVAMAEANVRVASKEIPVAVQLLEQAAAEAERRHLFAVGLEARLELGATELCCGDHTHGVEVLTAVEKNARARGYNRVARQAARDLAANQFPLTPRSPT